MRAFRGSVLHCLADPGAESAADSWEYFEDGLLTVADGQVVAAGPAEPMLGSLPADIEITDFSGKLLTPGFVDCHVHYPQLDIIGSHGAQLLDWLTQYAYPAEERFADADFARAMADVFVGQLLRHGTTTALVFGTVHAHSADAIFGAAAERNMRLVAGKVLMDTGCPEALCDDPATAYAESKALIERWHGRDRLGYAITPRFALTSSDAQLAAAGRLAAEYPDVWVHTHLAENHDEVASVAQRFPEQRSYLDVYAEFGLLRERSVFAHCLHLDAADREALAVAGGAAAFCPTSNLFLGSGLFDLAAMHEAGVRCGLGTDVGGGTSLSLLETAAEAYKVLHLQDQALPPLQGFYLATLGAAAALRLDDRIGNFAPGKEADFVVIDPDASTLCRRRVAAAASIEEKLFAVLTLGDERHIAATYVLGVLT